jgi:hypothetical protein
MTKGHSVFILYSRFTVQSIFNQRSCYDEQPGNPKEVQRYFLNSNINPITTNNKKNKNVDVRIYQFLSHINKHFSLNQLA